MSATTAITCPKCQAPMRAIERSGIVIDRCTDCGGVFLDRGELERLMQAEGEYMRRTDASNRDDDDDDDDYYGKDKRRPKKSSRRNFLEDLFDFG